jgi:hypothetical protein
MKKIPGLILVILLLAASAWSQESPIKLGLTVSPNIGWISSPTKEYCSNGISGGVNIGMTADFYFAEHYAFGTGFSFLFLDGRMNIPYAAKPDTGDIDRKYKFSYIVIPTTLKMCTKEFGSVSFYGQIGFETGFRLKATGRDDFHTAKNGTVSDKSDITDETTLMRFSAVIGAGSMVHIDKSTSIVVGLSYNNGLNNVLKGSNSRYPDRDQRGVMSYLTLNLGVIF